MFICKQDLDSFVFFILEQLLCLVAPTAMPRWGGSPWIWVSAQGSEETRMMGLPDGRKSFKDRFSGIDTIPACDGQPATLP